MRRFLFFLLLLAALLPSACAGLDDPGEPAGPPAGPALIMFYTDG